jgi:hypothetical protein
MFMFSSSSSGVDRTGSSSFHPFSPLAFGSRWRPTAVPLVPSSSSSSSSSSASNGRQWHRPLVARTAAATASSEGAGMGGSAAEEHEFSEEELASLDKMFEVRACIYII